MEELQVDVDEWLKKNNEVRPHSGRYCYGKTIMQTFLDSKTMALVKQLDSLHELGDNQLQLAKAQDASEEAPEHLPSVAPSCEVSSTPKLQVAKLNRDAMNLNLTDNNTLR